MKENTTNQNIGKRLKAMREEDQLTQANMAEIGGVSKRSQADYESGNVAPNANYLIALDNEGFDAYYLLTGNVRGPVLTPDNPNKAVFIKLMQEPMFEKANNVITLLSYFTSSTNIDSRLNAINLAKEWIDDVWAAASTQERIEKGDLIG